MPSNYKMLFTDVDGTILPAGGRISEEDRKFVSALTGRGIHVTVASGRCRDLVYPIVTELGLDKVPDSVTVAQNGGHIFLNASKKTISTSPADPVLIAELFRHATEFGIRCRSYSENYVYFNRPDPSVERFRQAYGCECLILPDPASQMPEPPIKFMVIDTDNSRIRAFHQETLPFTGDLLRAEFSSPVALEYTSNDVSKASGLKAVCGYYGLTVAESVAIGDGENDTSMIRAAGLGVAMANALPVLKECADLVTALPCEKSGFSVALKEIFAI